MRRASPSPEPPRRGPEQCPAPPTEGGAAESAQLPVKQETKEESSSHSSDSSAKDEGPLPPWPLQEASLKLTVDRVRRSNNREFWLSNLGPTLWLDDFPSFKGSSLLGVGGTRAVYISPTSDTLAWKIALKADPSHHGLEEALGHKLPGLCASRARLVGKGQLTIQDFKTLDVEVLEVERLELLPDPKESTVTVLADVYMGVQGLGF